MFVSRDPHLHGDAGAASASDPTGVVTVSQSHHQPSAEASSSESLREKFDKQYAKSYSGLLTIAEMILCIIILICLGSTFCGNCYQRGYLHWCTIWSLVWTIFFFVIFAFTLYAKITIINWVLSDAIFRAIHSLIFLVTSIAAATYRDGALLLKLASL